MSFLSIIEQEFQKDEAWVLDFLLAAKQTGQTIEADLKSAWTWIAAHMSEIASDAASVSAAVTTLNQAGIALPAAVGTAVQAMNAAVAGLNAAVSTSNAGGNAVQVISAAYVATKQASQAQNAAAQALVAMPAVAATPGSGNQ